MLTHVDAKGRIRMVDVGDKPVTDREAVARGSIAMSAAARKLIRSGAVKKGDPIQAARLAGIMAAKKTSELIPLCHPLNLSHVSVDLTPTRTGYAIEARVQDFRTDRRRDGSAHRGGGGGADALRHGQGGRQDAWSSATSSWSKRRVDAAGIAEDKSKT